MTTHMGPCDVADTCVFNRGCFNYINCAPFDEGPELNMKYTMTLALRDKNGEVLRSTVFTLDTEVDLTCDMGIAISPTEAIELMPRVEDISVSVREKE